MHAVPPQLWHDQAVSLIQVTCCDTMVLDHRMVTFLYDGLVTAYFPRIGNTRVWSSLRLDKSDDAEVFPKRLLLRV